MPYPEAPVGPRRFTLARSLRAGALALVLVAGCTAADEAPVEVLTASLVACAGAGGGPADGQPIEVNELLEVMSDDLRSIDMAEREGVRYVTMAHLYNAGASAACVETYRAAMNLALNSVSSGRRATAAAQLDATATIFRIELGDYGWDAATWQRLVAGYPYNVRYDSDSPVLSFRDDLADELREETGAAVPYVHGDWLAAAAMQPSLYYGLLALPDTLVKLEKQLGIDTVRATEEEAVARAGFVSSAASGASRMIARFDLPRTGAYWTSCDVDARWRATILTDPIDPICASREVLFTLPNGLPAYYLADGDGARLDTAPGPAATRIAGISCAGCHSATGVIARTDEVRSHVLGSANEAARLERVLALYPPRQQMAGLVDADQAGFTGARRAAGAPDTAVEPLTWVTAEHERPLDTRMAAAELGLEPETFDALLDHAGGVLPDAAQGLLRPGGRISRETWNQIYAEMVDALMLGVACDPDDRASACR